jgi:POT family proton-dependent oligopeptide transporter
MGSANGDAALSVERPGFWQTLLDHPAGFWFIFWGELAERCSYYGMRAILATYMVERLGLSRADGGTYVSLFIAACYFLPLLGGWIADRFLGKYLTIVLFSLPYILGHVVLGFENFPALAIALSLLAMGSGVIKPNISPLMGLTYDQYRPGQEQLRSNAFSIFYMSINIGAAISQIAVPFIRTTFNSYWLAFLFPAVLMAMSFAVFALGKPFYAHEVIGRRQKTPEERALQWKVVGQVGLLFLLVMFFWAIFDQASSTWIFFAKSHMSLDLFVLGYQVDAEMMQAINPILIVVILPITTVLWTALDARGIRVRATDKMIIGFVLTAFCMGVMAFCGFAAGEAQQRPVVEDGQPVLVDGAPKMEDWVPPDERVSIRWQALAYLFITMAEILISVTGLELAFVAAPKSMKSFVTSLWLVSVGMANLFVNVPLSRLYPQMAPGHYFMMLTGMLVAVAVAFYFVGLRFNRMTVQAAAAADLLPMQPPISDDGVREGYPASKPSAGIQAGLPPE